MSKSKVQPSIAIVGAIICAIGTLFHIESMVWVGIGLAGAIAIEIITTRTPKKHVST